MAKRDRYKDAKNKRDSGTFITLPLCVLNGAAYLGLSSHARMLLLDLAAQYRGNNNGDLCAAFSMMKVRGWKSTHTLLAAKLALIEAGLIVETRKGACPSKASLYALTWHSIDDCGGKLDIKPQSFQRSAYKLKDKAPSLNEMNEKSPHLMPYQHH